METRFYYYRDALRRPMVTLCRVMTEAGTIGYGWAICSSLDAPHKNDEIFLHPDTQKEWREPGGKARARGRAVRALTRGKQLNDTVHIYARPILRPEALGMLTDCQAGDLYYFAETGNYTLLPPVMRPPCAEERR